MTDKIKLSIVIVNWNAYDLLRQCLNSFLFNGFNDYLEVIIVDNGSTDGSVEKIKKEFPCVMVLENSSNMGFARANNQAIKVAGGEYILLLNSDTMIQHGRIFEKWVKFMDLHPEAAASGCRLIFPDGSHQVGDAGFKPSLSTVMNHCFFLSRAFPCFFKGLFLSYGRLKNVIEVDWVSGAALLIRKSVLSKVGLLDEGTFMFAEDIEWGCRVKALGYKIFYLPCLEIVHLQGGSSKRQSEQAIFSFLWLENLRRLYFFYHKNQPTIFYDLIMHSGFLLRCFIYYVGFLIKSDRRMKVKSEKMFNYFKYRTRELRDINVR